MAKLQCNLGFMLTFYLLITLRTYVQGENTKLRLISVIFRHGDRTADPSHSETYPTDPYRYYQYYPHGLGQLTNVGKKRAYELGLQLRDNYLDFLENTYWQPHIYARCTSVVRTKMTLQLVLAGLYPPSGLQRWHPTLNWQPVDIVYENNYQDPVLFPIMCRKYKQIYDDMLRNNTDIRRKVENFDDLMKYVSINSGKNITKIYNLMNMYHTLAAELSFGLELPTWTKKIFPWGRLFDAIILQYELFSYESLNRLYGGIYLRQIINDMDEIIKGTSTRLRLNLFSAHDVNVVAVLIALKIYDYRVPDFTSSVIIELREAEEGGSFFVSVLRYLGTPSKMIVAPIPDCTLLCPYEKFVELTSDIIATDKEATCPEGLTANFDF